MKNTITFNGNYIEGSVDLNEIKMICIPSKPQYKEVNICFKDGMNIQIGEIAGKSVSFEDRIKIGKEIAKRWNAYEHI